MPRPDVELLGVSYRRMPILSIGRDVYLDTRLIIKKLESLFPPSAAHPGISSAHALISLTPSSEKEETLLRVKAAEHTALEQLLSDRVIDGDVFRCGAQCFSASVPKDESFVRDRAALVGIDMSKPGAISPFAPEVIASQVPGARVSLGRWIRWLEEGLLADGRDWILDSNSNIGPSLADLEAVWVLYWVYGVPGGLPTEILGPESAPKVYAWIRRFDEAVKRAEAEQKRDAPPRRLSGDEAAKLIAGSPFAEPDAEEVSSHWPFDPVVKAEGLSKGVPVKMWPTDYGSSYRDRGTLVLIDDLEFIIEAKGGAYGSVRIHAPRHGFKVARDKSSDVPSSSL